MPSYNQRQCDHDPFAAIELWPQEFASHAHDAEPGSIFQLPDFDLPGLKLPYRDDLERPLPSAFELRNLAAFAHNALPPLEDLPDASICSLEEQSPSSDSLSFAASAQDSKDEIAEDDIWRDPTTLPTLKGQTRLLTWSSFANKHLQHDVAVKSPSSGLISEAGPRVFDAAVVEHARTSDGRLKAGRAIKSDAFLNSLFELALGRASLLFPFNEEKGCFHTAIEDGRVTGTTLQLSRAIIEDFTHLGNTTRLLRSFVSSVYGKQDACAGLVAFANVTRMNVDAIEESRVAQRQHVTSILQLQQLFEQPKALLDTIRAIYGSVKVEELSSIDDEAVAWSAFEALQEYEVNGMDVTIVQAFFRRVSQPWLEQLERQIGLRRDTMPQSRAVKSAKQDSDARSGMNVSRFMSNQDIKTINETHECIAYMQQHHPGHPLSTPEKLNGDQYGFEWTKTWSDVDRVIAKAQEYRETVQAAIATLGRSHVSADSPDTSKTSQGGQLDSTHAGPWSIDLESDISLRLPGADVLDMQEPDELLDLVHAYLTSVDMVEESSEALPTALMSQTSLQLVLKAQHALLTTATLDSVLRVHQLSYHLNTLHTFHLFGSGPFATSLSHVLFAPDIELAERRKGVARSGRRGAMGLALGSGHRREWPPTSSELSLALMGVLEDCGANDIRAATAPNQTFSLHSSTNVETSTQPHIKPARTNSSLSFALRTKLDPSTIERILDASTLYALDFLKLSYTPPLALRLVLTDEILNKYDRIFQLLLRLLRIQFVISQLYTDFCIGRPVKNANNAQDNNTEHSLQLQFRHHATHFITTLLTYFQYTAIETPWRELMQYIACAEAHCNDSSSSSSSNRQYTLTTLRTTHESTLNRMLSGLFLPRRQVKLAELLESILSDILTFTQKIRPSCASQTSHSSHAFPVHDTSKETKTQTEIGVTISISALYARFTTHHSQFINALEEAAQRAEMGKGMRGDTTSMDVECRDMVEGFVGLASLLK